MVNRAHLLPTHPAPRSRRLSPAPSPPPRRFHYCTRNTTTHHHRFSNRYTSHHNIHVSETSEMVGNGLKRTLVQQYLAPVTMATLPPIHLDAASLSTPDRLRAPRARSTALNTAINMPRPQMAHTQTGSPSMARPQVQQRSRPPPPCIMHQHTPCHLLVTEGKMIVTHRGSVWS